MEEYLRRALLLSRGDPSVLITSPISGTILLLCVVLVAMVALPFIRGRRDDAFAE